MKKLLIFIAALLIPFQLADAGFSTSRSSPGRSFSSPSRSTPSTSSSKPSSGFSSSKGSSAAPSTSSSKNAFDSSAAKRSIPPPKPKADYVNDFKAQNASKYPTKFDHEPTTRPSYVPNVYQNHTIVYNQGYGGYGYFDALGHWMMFDAVTHMAMNSYDRDLRAYNNAPIIATGWSSWGIFWFWFGIILLVVLVVAIINRD